MKYLILILFLVAISSAYAQKDFRPGYVVKGGDTLRGLLWYRGNHNSQAVTFKTDKRSKAITYTPQEVSAYGFPGDKRYEVIDIGTTEVPKMAFGLALQKGEIDLYYTKEKYLLVKDEERIILDRKPDSIATKTKYGEAQPVFVNDVGYVQTLNMLLVSDCGLNANSTQFSRRQISRLIGKFNKCVDNYIEIKNTRPAATVGASLAFGVYQSVLTLDTLPNATFKSATSSVWQLDVEVRLPRFTDRIAIAVGFQPVKTTYTGSNSVTSTTQTIHDDMTLKVNYFKIPITVKYNFGNPQNSFFVKAGGWQGKRQDVKFTTHRTYRANSGGEQTTDQGVGNSYRNPAGVMLGVGYDKRVSGRLRVFGELRHEINSGFVGLSAAPFSAFNFTNLMVGIGI